MLAANSGRRRWGMRGGRGEELGGGREAWRGGGDRAGRERGGVWRDRGRLGDGMGRGAG